MDIVKSVVLVLHLLAFAAMFGATIAQFKQAKIGEAKISRGLLHCAIALLVTGLALVGLTYAVGGAPNNLKIGVKTAVLLVVFALVIVGNGKQKVTSGFLGAITALLALNVALAVLWN